MKWLLKQSILYEICIASIIMVLSITSSLYFRAYTLTTWDAVQFALALKEYNIFVHQPHPPGYISWIVLLKTVNYLVGDPNLSAIILNSVIAGLSTYIIYYIMYMFYKYSKAFSLLVSLTWLFNPVTWYYRSIAENYVVGVFFTLLILTLLYFYRETSRYKHLLLAVFITGFSGGFRIEIPVFLLPAIIYIILTRDRSKLFDPKYLFIVITSYIVGILVWFIPQIMICNGFTPWLQATLRLFGSRFKLTAIGVAPSYSFYANFIASTHILFFGNGWNIFSIVLLVTNIYLYLQRKLFLTIHDKLLLATLLIFYLFSAIIHMGKTGYLLPATPLLTILLSKPSYLLRSSWNKILYLILSILIILNAIFYLLPAGELIDVLRTHHSYQYIASRDRSIRQLHEIMSRFNASNTVIVVYNTPSDIDWRKVMYYEPQYLSIHLGVVEDKNTFNIEDYIYAISQNYRYFPYEKIRGREIKQCVFISSHKHELEEIGIIGSNTYVYVYRANNIDECLNAFVKR